MIRARIDVSGVIQGVGFRPFIYRLANEQDLKGYVANTAAGVVIEIDGAAESINRFIDSLSTQKPPLASIADLSVKKTGIDRDASADTFVIRESIAAGPKVGPVTADTDVCGNCLTELLDPADRRFKYPFMALRNPAFLY